MFANTRVVVSSCFGFTAGSGAQRRIALTGLAAGLLLGLAACGSSGGGGGGGGGGSGGGTTTPSLPGFYAFVADFNVFAVVGFKGDGDTGALTPLRATNLFTTGEGPAFESPAGIAVDPNGRLLVANFNGSTVSTYQFDATTGGLTLNPYSPSVGVEPYAVGYNAAGTLAFATNLSTQTVASYTVDATTGALTSTGPGLATGISPSNITVDEGTSSLFVADVSDGTVSGFHIATDGTLTALSGSPFPAGTSVNRPTGVTLAHRSALTFAYAADQHDGTVWAYSVASDGTLSAVAGSPFTSQSAGSSQAVVMNAANTVAYVVNTGSVSAMSVSGTDGVLAHLAGSPYTAGGGTTAFAITPSGSFGYALNTGAATISAYSIAGNGVLTQLTGLGSPFATGTNALAMAIDATGKYLFAVAHDDNRVWSYAIGADGALTPVSGNPFTTGSAPAALAVDPSGSYLYVVNSGDDDMSGFSIDSSTGVLTALTSGTMVKVGDEPQDVVIDTAHKRAFVPNTNDATVNVFTIDTSTGLPTEVAGSPFTLDNQPSSFALTPSGDYGLLIASSEGGGEIAAYSIDASGTPTFLNSAPLNLSGLGPVVTFDSTGTIAYVANTGGAEVSIFSIDASGVTAVGTPVTTPDSDPNGVTLHPSGKFAYVTGGDCDCNPYISVYQVGGTGLLTGEVDYDNSTTLSGWVGGAPQPLVLNADGTLAFVADRNHADVYVFTVNASDGSLTQVAGSPFATGGSPGGVTLNAAGTVAYVPNADDGTVSIFSVASDGVLTELTDSPVTAGAGASRVVLDPTGAFAYVVNPDEGTISPFTVDGITGLLTVIGAGSVAAGPGARTFSIIPAAQ